MNERIEIDCPRCGGQFLKFCGKYELNRLSEQAQSFAEFLSASYPEGVK